FSPKESACLEYLSDSFSRALTLALKEATSVTSWACVFSCSITLISLLDFGRQQMGEKAKNLCRGAALRKLGITQLGD
ncbi:MAG: hypothetical protein COX16_12065, partial [Deltaproteobacteria bacterium CG23_combo_of_CG06-09_8_20_14_all_51_20]